MTCLTSRTGKVWLSQLSLFIADDNSDSLHHQIAGLGVDLKIARRNSRDDGASQRPGERALGGGADD
ncbi:hypothetical protein [Lignipirellula cremea]|uniref:hypothetical protein n=1 Tax=Lignipirellula cremea TaxID=2528010 RepID=UPI0011A46FC8|nr:hypothetical protein [Lignipirellula cremea]